MRSARRTLALVALAALLFAASNAVKGKVLEAREGWPAGDAAALLPEPRFLPVLAMGYRELAADLYWVRALVHGGADRGETFERGHLEELLDGLFALDPHFEAAYRWASTAVMVAGEEIDQRGVEASARYLEQAIEHFPDNWRFHWQLGVRYWLDLEADTDEELLALRERGAELIERAMRLPDAPARLATQAATIRTRLGQRDRALSELRQMILTTEDEDARQVLIARYRQLEGDAGMADELSRARADFEKRWQRELPFAPADLFIVLGEGPGKPFDLEKLAAPRDLFGTGDGPAAGPDDPLGLASPRSRPSPSGASKPNAEGAAGPDSESAPDDKNDTKPEGKSGPAGSSR